MDVARRDVVGVAHEQIHVADDRRLVGEIAHVGRQVVVVRVGARELDGSFGARGEPLDESFELFARDGFAGDRADGTRTRCRQAAGKRVGGHGDDQRGARSQLLWAERWCSK